MNARWGGDFKLDFKENRSIPPSYLSSSQHQACQKFIQWNHLFSCCFIVVVNHLAINLQCFNSFLAWVIIRVVCPAQKNGVPTTRTSRPFGADRDFADTSQGVPEPHPYCDRCVSTMLIVNMQEVSHEQHLIWFSANSPRNSNTVSIP